MLNDQVANSTGDFQRKKKHSLQLCAPTHAETIAVKAAIFRTYLPRYIHCMGPQYLHSVKFNLILPTKRVSFWKSMLTEVPKLAFSVLTNRTPLRNRTSGIYIFNGFSEKTSLCWLFHCFFLNCLSSIKAKKGGRPNSFAGKKPMKTFYILL